MEMKDYEEPLRSEPLDLLRDYLMVSNMVMDTVSVWKTAEVAKQSLEMICYRSSVLVGS